MCNRTKWPCEDGGACYSVTSVATTSPAAYPSLHAHDTCQLGSLFSILALVFSFFFSYLHSLPNLQTRKISHPPVLLHLKALDSEGREINKGGNLDTGEVFFRQSNNARLMLLSSLVNYQPSDNCN